MQASFWAPLVAPLLVELPQGRDQRMSPRQSETGAALKIEWNSDDEVCVDDGAWRTASPLEHRLRDLLMGLVEVEDQPCSFDHHGYCQEHGWFGEPGECYTRLAREAVGLSSRQTSAGLGGDRAPCSDAGSSGPDISDERPR